MSPAPQRGTPAGDATLAIQRLARETGATVQELQTLYVLEALLARIADSPFRDDFVLKGGVLLASFEMRRATRDIDLQATRITNSSDAVADRIKTIAMLDLGDGIEFIRESISASIIRDNNLYSGIRVKLNARFGTARITIGVDVNFGDPIVPAPSLTEVPRLVDLNLPPIHVLGSPLVMVLAEKIITAVERGEVNTRWRDFADIYSLIRIHTVTADQLRQAFEAITAFRRLQLYPLLPSLEQMPAIAQAKWQVWRTNQRRDKVIPESFEEVLTELAAFADPVISGAVAAGDWNPTTQHWITTYQAEGAFSNSEKR